MSYARSVRYHPQPGDVVEVESAKGNLSRRTVVAVGPRPFGFVHWRGTNDGGKDCVVLRASWEKWTTEARVVKRGSEEKTKIAKKRGRLNQEERAFLAKILHALYVRSDATPDTIVLTKCIARKLRLPPVVS